MEKIKTIKKINLFKNLEDNEIAALLRCFSLKFIEFRERKKIANRLDRIDNLYIVLSGAAREAWYNEEGDVITYIDYREGDIIGLEYVSGVRKTFSGEIIAIEDMFVMALDSFRFLNPCNNFFFYHWNFIH